MGEKTNIGRDSLILTITQFVTLGVNMINAMLLSRFRTLGEYGTYSQVMSICSIIITFMAAGFSQCINYFLGKSEKEEDKHNFVKNYYAVISATGVIGGLLALLLMPILRDYYGNDSLARFWFVFLFYPISHILTSGTDRFFIAYKKAKGLFTFKVGHSVIVLAEMFIALLLDFSFYQYMVIYTVFEVLFGISVFVWIRLITGVVPMGGNKTWLCQIIRFAFPMALASLVSSINTELDKLIVGGFVDTDTFAVYTNAARELPIYILSTSISSVVMPHVVRKAARKEYSGAVKLWNNSIVLSYYLVCFCVTALIVFSPQIISLLYSDKYLPGVSVFRIYSLVLLFRVTYYGMMLNALGKTKSILKASVVMMLSNLVLDLLFYQLLGLIGPAIATLLSVAFMNFYQLYLTKSYIGIRFTDIYPLKKMFYITVLNVMMGLAAYLIHKCILHIVDINQIVLAIAIGIVWLVTYFLVIRKDIIHFWNYLNKGEIRNG